MASLVNAVPAGYQLHSGETDRKRALGLNGVFDSYSVTFFPYELIHDGDDILFPGCGNGIHLLKIAEQLRDLGKNVNLFGTDLKAAQVLEAKKNAEAMGITNVEFSEENINNMGTAGKKYNVIAVRFVLNHVPHAEKVAAEICNALKSKGLLITELTSGPIHFNVDTDDQIFAMKRYEEGTAKLHHLQGSNLTCGREVVDSLTKNNMIHLHITESQPQATTSDQKVLFCEALPYAKQLLASEYTDPATLEKLKKSFEEIQTSESCTVGFEFIQALSQRQN